MIKMIYKLYFWLEMMAIGCVFLFSTAWIYGEQGIFKQSENLKAS